MIIATFAEAPITKPVRPRLTGRTVCYGPDYDTEVQF